MGLLLFAALHDIVARTVPNGVSVLLALVGLGARVLDNNLLFGATMATTVFVVAAFCWRRGWLGGADVKLMGSATLAVPAGQVLTFIAAMSVAGSILAICYLVAGRLARRRSRPNLGPSSRPTALLSRAARVELWRLRRGGPLPYACAIAAGFLLIQF